jgi:fructosamine-3-kinase
MKNRLGIYYWKCDRPHAFHALNKSSSHQEENELKDLVNELLTHHFGSSLFTFSPSGSQGNHFAFIVEFKSIKYFLRIENGPECDDYMEIEAKLLNEVRTTGVPTPHVFAVDASRKIYPFAYQLLEYFEYPDLNSFYKKGNLNIAEIAVDIGKNIAQYQNIRPVGYGLFDPAKLQESGNLTGLHNSYRDYFFLNWEKHLDFLLKIDFLTSVECKKIKDIVNEHDWCLKLERGCLVHKDMALWNIIGSKNTIKAIIDWDDAISGDPTDDISLLACFHSGEFINSVLEGYKEIRDLPDNFLPRFWLHLLRNMIVKSVIRVGAGYFDLKDDFFLIGSGKSGESLKQFTKDRINLAYQGLYKQINISEL